MVVYHNITIVVSVSVSVNPIRCFLFNTNEFCRPAFSERAKFKSTATVLLFFCATSASKKYLGEIFLCNYPQKGAK